MIKIQYKNLQRSEFVDNLIVEKMQALKDKHPELDRTRTYVWLDMQNSWSSHKQASFSARLEIRGAAVGQVHMLKYGETLYEAISELMASFENKVSRLHKKNIARKKRRASAAEAFEDLTTSDAHFR